MKYEVGSTYIIDKKFANPIEVVLESKGKYFCSVRDPKTNATWDTMLSRLSPK